MYSQREEEKYILEFFKDKKKGTVLEIGAFNAELFSNSRALILKGWDAVLIEASPKCYNTICSFYQRECANSLDYFDNTSFLLKNGSSVYVYNYAIAEKNGELEFYDSEGAVATGSKQHYDIWKTYQKDFKVINVPSLSWDTFNSTRGFKCYDFISIDVEGMDWEVLKQIDLNKTQTELLCIEMTYNADEIAKYLTTFTPKFEIIMMNSENLMVGRKL